MQTIEEAVKHRRSQMLIHSYLYYHLDDPIIPDDKWQEWAEDLTELHKTCTMIGFYDKEFADWDGSTGMHLPVDDFVREKAHKLRLYRDKNGTTIT
jgi:hypothetical protein